MNRTREIVSPTDALKFLVATLNSPSIQHERLDMREIYLATAEAMKGRAHKPLTLTGRGVVIEGLTDIIAQIHAWKPAPYDIRRGVHGTRVYTRLGPKKADAPLLDAQAIVDQIEHRLDRLPGRRSGRA